MGVDPCNLHLKIQCFAKRIIKSITLLVTTFSLTPNKTSVSVNIGSKQFSQLSFSVVLRFVQKPCTISQCRKSENFCLLPAYKSCNKLIPLFYTYKLQKWELSLREAGLNWSDSAVGLFFFSPWHVPYSWPPGRYPTSVWHVPYSWPSGRYPTSAWHGCSHYLFSCQCIHSVCCTLVFLVTDLK